MAHSHTGCHLGAWITSLDDYPAQIKKLTVLSLFTVLFGKQNLRKLTLSLGLAAFAGSPRNYSSKFIICRSLLGASQWGLHDSHTPIISRAIRWRIKCPCRLGTVTRKELEMKGNHHLEDCKMEEERESEKAMCIYGMSGGHWGPAGPGSGGLPLVPVFSLWPWMN